MTTKVIIVTGKAQSGKDSSCEYIKTLLKQYGLSSGIYAFADSLKKICVNLFNLEPVQCWGENKDKDRKTEFQWRDVPLPESEKIDFFVSCNRVYSPDEYMTSRDIMQIWGTNIFRRFNPLCWVQSTLKKVKEDNFDFALISDARFQNEIDAFNDKDPLVIRLTRDLLGMKHRSESEMDSIDYSRIRNFSIIDNQSMNINDKNHFLKLVVEEYLESNDNRSSTKSPGRLFQRQSD